MPQLDRESELARRFQQRKDLEDRRKTKKKLASKARGRAKEGADGVSDRTARLAARGAELERKYLQEAQEEGEVPGERWKGSDDDDDDDRAGAGDDDDDAAGSKRGSGVRAASAAPAVTDEAAAALQREATYEDVLGMGINREKLVRWHAEPYFDKVVVGALVRVNIGVDANQVAIYRVAEIKEVKRKNYTYMAEGKQVDVQLVLSMAGALKLFKMTAISNKPYTEPEFRKWVKVMRENNKPLPTVGQAQTVRGQIVQAREHVYTQDEVDKLVEQRSRDLRKLPINVVRQKKAETIAAIKVQMDRVPLDEDKLRQLREQLEDIERLIEEKAVKVERNVSKVGSTYNERVREAMFKTSTEGQENYYGDDGEDRSSAAPNPFVRRKTIQHVMHVGEEADRLQKEQDAEKKRKEDAESEQARLRTEREARRAADPIASDMHALKRKKTDAEPVDFKGLTAAAKQLVDAHDFDLDLEI